VSSRELLRPLPLALLFAFAAVAVVDLVHSLREEPPPWPDLLADRPLRFERWEPVLDLRARAGPDLVELLPAVAFDAAHWSAPLQGGRWVLGEGAGLELGLARGGHRTLVVECRGPSGGDRAVQVEVGVNGARRGAFEVGSEWRRHLVRLPGDAVLAGSNQISLRLPDRPSAGRSQRGVLVRRLGLFFDAEAAADAVQRRSPVAVDLEAERVGIWESGTLIADFTVDERIDALKLSYHFSADLGRAELTVARPEGGGPGRDAVMRRTLAASDGREGGVRFPLHGRRGEFRFAAEVELGPQPGSFDLSSVRLVREGVPTQAEARQRSRRAE
jgi:hypothetical protein